MFIATHAAPSWKPGTPATSPNSVSTPPSCRITTRTRCATPSAGCTTRSGQPQGKLIIVSHGAIFDVAVDLRRDSPFFGQWVGEVLSEENRRMLWVPPGFAHGFYVISDVADCQFKCTDYYAPQHEQRIRWNDDALDIEWPLRQGTWPLLSEKDKNNQRFRECLIY